MASAQLAIAKASLLASLLKADADADLASCSRDEIEQFHGLLTAAVAKCSPTNVQKCKQWILQHLVPSPARTAAFGKYLVALSSSFPSGAQKAPGPSPKRRRLHVLYILNDVLFHLKFRTHEHSFFEKIEPHLPVLFRSAASFTNAPKHMKKLHGLIQLWGKKAYFSDSVLEPLHAAVEEGPKTEGLESNGGGAPNKAYTSSIAREAPFILPSMHGDASTPWYDLPAANWLPVIEPNSTRPMNPSMIKPLQLAGGPADKNLVDAVKKLLGDVDKIYAKTQLLDGDSSVDGSTRLNALEQPVPESQPAAFLKARLLTPGHQTASALALTKPELEQRVAISQPWEKTKPQLRAAAKLFTLSVSIPLSTTGPEWQRQTQVPFAPPNPQQHYHQQPPPPPPASYSPSNFPVGVPPQPPQPGTFISWNAAAPPPPPPPHYQGHWPPPPPPPPPPHMSPAAGQPPPQGWFPPHHSPSGPPAPGAPPGSWAGGWVPPPPPYPPQGHLEQQQQQPGGLQYGRGGNGGGYRGRGGGGGGYGRGRGW
ncbi:hypothetical protein diail_12248 [Diaporthe ilicicola]|nr:hypothetical protein diail_12248 [Diaporthe ilicicola]